MRKPHDPQPKKIVVGRDRGVSFRREPMKYKALLIDPPWHFATWSGSAKRNAPYQTQSLEWVAGLPVGTVAAADSCVFLWATWPSIKDAFGIIERWGFQYKTLAFDWIKHTQAGEPRINLGYWTRANSEPCLLATRGNPKRLDKGVGQVIVSGLGRHSEKPMEVYERIERLVEGPYLELFARPNWGILGPRPGWVHLGNEVTGRDMAVDLRDLAEGRIPPGASL